MYCNYHNTNNCVECAIERHTQQIVDAIKRLEPKPKLSIAERVQRWFLVRANPGSNQPQERPDE